MKFTEFGFNEGLIEALYYMGFEKATPIQEQAIPAILDNKDLIACAQTGTGKTAAFILPIIHKLIDRTGESVNTLIICPTRELAIQIEQQIQAIGYFSGISSIAIYGGGSGQEWETQKRALRTGADIVVATPGKFISHLNMGYVKLDNLKHLILDEADRMLDMGFSEDIQSIINKLPRKRQTLLFSATMPPKIRQLAKKTLVDPMQISIAVSKPAAGVLQISYLAHDHQKTPLIKKLLKDKDNYKSIIIFCSTKKKVNEVYKSLRHEKYEIERISSELEQKEREQVLNLFAARKIRVLVATDVLSRGIDIKDINLVINYDVPPDPEDYVHRIGRTARADTSGLAITMINEKDMRDFAKIETLIESEIKKLNVPKELGESPRYQVNQRRKGNNNWRGKKKPYRKKR